jgi:hypothetical protein
VDFSGRSADVNINNLPLSDPTSWWWSKSQGGSISFGVPGAEFPSRGMGGMQKFLPAVGYRTYDNGSINYQGALGYYWTNEVAISPFGGHSIIFSTTGLQLHASYALEMGMSVRCVYNP